MKRLGISIYPEHSTIENDKKYIKKAHENGFTRIFTCLLSVKQDKEIIKNELKEILGYANSLGMETILDVAPSVFNDLGITYNDLSFFSEVGAQGIRLDEGFDGAKEATMTFNPQGLKLEINASQPTKYLDIIMSYQPAKGKIIACHNFYPQKYTGLGLALFNECNKNIKKYDVPIAAFVSSNNNNTYGPWDVYEGLPTLELHRTLPIDVQARHLFQLGIDDVLIGNAYASDEELEALKQVNPSKLQFKLDLQKNLTDVELEIIYDYPHYVRGDMSDYMARSTFSRIDYKDATIKPGNTRDLTRGDIIIVNENYGRYKGELHIVLEDMPNEGNKNVVGRIKENELFLLDYIKPWQKFGFIR